MEEYKQVILVRKDLKLPKGKLAVQVAHASVEATLKSDKKNISEWRKQGMKKVALYVETLKDIFTFKSQAEEADLTDALIIDAGKTVVEPGTITCLAIGPDRSEKIDRLTSNLKMV